MKINGFSVRNNIKKDDNKKILALERECPMEGFVSFYYDHSPKFFKFFRIFGKYVPYFVEDNNKLIAFLGGSIINVKINGKIASTLIGTNLRVKPDYRGRGIGYKLLRLGFERTGVKHDIALTFNIESNIPILKTFKKFPEFTFNPLNLYQFLPFKKYKTSGKYVIRKAEKGDIKEIYSLIKSHLNNYFVHPYFDIKVFKNELKKTPNYKIKNIHVALKDGKIVACLGLWDQRSVRKIILTGIPFRLKLLGYLLKVWNFFFNVPQIPSIGEELRTAHFRHMAYKKGHKEAYKDLVSHVLNYCRLNNYLLVLTSTSPSDSINTVYKKFLKLRNKLFLGFWSRSKFKVTKKDLKKPIYLDTSML